MHPHLNRELQKFSHKICHKDFCIEIYVSKKHQQVNGGAKVKLFVMFE